MKQPQGFEVEGKEDCVCKLKRNIYGLKKSSRCWNETLDEYLKELGFRQSSNDPCIYILDSGGEMFIVAVYVDDIILAGTSLSLINEFVDKIGKRFEIKDMGKLHYFLGVKVIRCNTGKIWIGQATNTKETLKKFKMENSKLVATPAETGSKRCINLLLVVSCICQHERDRISLMLLEMLQDFAHNQRVSIGKLLNEY